MAVGLILVLVSEVLTGLAAGGDPARTPLVLALLVTGGERPPLLIGYPTIHWLAIMLLGWSWGRNLIASGARGTQVARQLALAGLGALAVSSWCAEPTRTATCSLCARMARSFSGCT